MNTAPSTRRQWWIAVVCGMASYIDAAAIVGSGIAIVIYQGTLGLTAGEVGLFQGALTLAIGIGALFGGRLGDRLGRRPVFTATMIMVVIGAGVLVFASTPWLLVAGAVLVGLGTGADLPVSLSTISEAADEKNRGKLVSFSQQLWLVGIVAAALLGTLFGDLGRLGGQILFGHVGVMALIVLGFRLTIGESETWRTARDERAKGVVTIRAQRSNLRILLSGRYLVPFLGLGIFYALINVAANTNGQFSAYLLVNAAGQTPSFASLVGLISLPFGLIFGFWFMAVVDTKRRFAYFIAGGILSILSPLVPTILGFSVPTYIVALVLSLPAGAFAGEAIMKVWAQESFPTLLRTTAQGTIIAFARFVAAGIATLTPLIVTAGASVLYGILTALSAAGVIVAFLVFRHRDAHSEFAIEAQESTTTVRTQA